MNKQSIMLIVLDGFGISDKKKYNAIAQAHTPFLDRFMQEHPYTTLHASGRYVGLPEGYIGNSEVGHMTIGTGRIIEQPVTIINNVITENKLCSNKTLSRVLTHLKITKKPLHIMGLLSDAGVHCHIDHLIAYAACAALYSVQTYYHLFLDGRDMLPRSAVALCDKLVQQTASCNASIASLHGRFFAMDRDNNWGRTVASYNVLTQQSTDTQKSYKDIIKTCYTKNITDEFIFPTQLDPDGFIKDGDALLCANFRADRARQLLTCFLTPEKIQEALKQIHLSSIITPVSYVDGITTDILLEIPPVEQTLKDQLYAAGKTMLSVAETEKYAHVTYFFNGQKETRLSLDEWVLIPSKPANSYGKCPALSAKEITNIVCEKLYKHQKDFCLINYANADMVAHSGDFDATVKAIECLDTQVGIVYNLFVQQMGGMMIITSDHGNAEDMFDELSQQPRTAHTTNKVPFLCITNDLGAKPDISMVTELADIAPFILRQMQIEIPDVMK